MLSEYRWYSVQGALLDQIYWSDRAPFSLASCVDYKNNWRNLLWVDLVS